ncbi:protein crossbronx homolog isoform X2 [Zootermopsis nevadensis]|uniref:protein crossbronx homolog isoform X2 n=1 Tax=Zootermopsis nevadensis TaxID=136037 RepID=UPI000B8E823B|nr:protein crossbronx homolog isoform X2 [Zootermopsis nevadensis]
MDLKSDADIDGSESFRRQGSFRKVLPSVPSADSQLSMSAKMIDRPAISNRGQQKAYSQYQQEYSIISEYNMLRKQEFPGIYVIPSAQNCLLWFGVLFVRQGVYQGGIFRFCIQIPEGFPDGECPRVVFQSKIFHPMISPNSWEMDLRSGFQEWRKNVNHIWQVVHYVRRAFYKIETKSPLNQEASELYNKNEDAFCENVKLCVKASQEQVYDLAPTDDLHYISFERYDDERHNPVRESIFKVKDNEDEPSSLGLSWVQPGSLQPFSKPTS